MPNLVVQTAGFQNNQFGYINNNVDLPNTDIITDANVLARTSCQQIVAAAKGSPASFLTDYKITSTGAAAANDMYTNLNQFVTNIERLNSQTAGYASVDTDTINSNSLIMNTYIPFVRDTYIPLLRNVKQCLQESTIPDYAALKQQQATTEESKSRLEAIKTPERRVSYYESWFPLVRPISEPGLFGLFGAGLLFLVFAISLFLRMGGIEFQVTSPTIEFNPSDYKSYIYTGMIIGLIIGIAMYGYKKRGWFGGDKQQK